MKRLLLLIALFPFLIYAQTSTDSLTSKLAKLTGGNAIVGYAVAIINRDSILYARGFGYADREKKLPYTTKTVQPIASISKTLIGVSLMKAQELGMLDLNDNINQYLPFKIINPRFPDSEIKIRHLANHTSSLRDTRHYEKSYIFYEPIPKIQKNFPFGFKRLMVKMTVNRYNKNKKIPLADFIRNIYVPKGKWYSRKSFGKLPPGGKYTYCNNGAAIASMIIENASGMAYTDFVKTYIMKPLGMEYSGWDLKDYNATEKSKLYPFLLEIPDYKLITLADGGFITNVLDFSKYLSAVIRGYNGEDNIITSTSYNKMLKEYVLFGQGIFWSIDEFESKDYIGHTGGDPGVQTVAIIDTKNNFGYIGFSNSNTPNYEELNTAIKILIDYSKKNLLK